MYHADEIGVNWKAIPYTTLVSKSETSATGHKVTKDCDSASSMNSKQLLLIRKSKNPSALRNVRKGPAGIQKSTESMDDSGIVSSIFLAVKQYQNEVGRGEWCCLL